MRKLQRAAVTSALIAAGLGVAGAGANATTAAPGHGSQAAMVSWSAGSVRANERVVEAFIPASGRHVQWDDVAAVVLQDQRVGEPVRELE